MLIAAIAFVAMVTCLLVVMWPKMETPLVANGFVWLVLSLLVF